MNTLKDLNQEVVLRPTHDILCPISLTSMATFCKNKINTVAGCKPLFYDTFLVWFPKFELYYFNLCA